MRQMVCMLDRKHNIDIENVNRGALKWFKIGNETHKSNTLDDNVNKNDFYAVYMNYEYDKFIGIYHLLFTSD